MRFHRHRRDRFVSRSSCTERAHAARRALIAHPKWVDGCHRFAAAFAVSNVARRRSAYRVRAYGDRDFGRDGSGRRLAAQLFQSALLRADDRLVLAGHGTSTTGKRLLPERMDLLAICEMTDAEHLARALVWAATHEPCANEAFNITNGDYIRWRNVWPEIASIFRYAGRRRAAGSAHRVHVR